LGSMLVNCLGSMLVNCLGSMLVNCLGSMLVNCLGSMLVNRLDELPIRHAFIHSGNSMFSSSNNLLNVEDIVPATKIILQFVTARRSAS
jgi:hypothetical protein